MGGITPLDRRLHHRELYLRHALHSSNVIRKGDDTYDDVMRVREEILLTSCPPVQ